jgi:hypothetical protein
MSTLTVDSAANVLADPSAYADEPRLHASLGHLRCHAPVAWVDKAPYRPAPPELAATTFVGGLKHPPIRYGLRN